MEVAGLWVESNYFHALDLAVDENGFAHIAYHGYTLAGSTLLYLTNRDGGWTMDELDSFRDPGWSPAIVIGGGSIHITYLDRDFDPFFEAIYWAHHLIPDGLDNNCDGVVD